jgi:hypothetical protein
VIASRFKRHHFDECRYVDTFSRHKAIVLMRDSRKLPDSRHL